MLLILAFALQIVASLSEEAPRAPGLAQSHWPIAHASTWNSDFSDNPGPHSKDASVQLFLNGETIKDLNDILASADPITLVQSNITGYTWGSSISSVFQTFTDKAGVHLINTYFRDYNFAYHGAYSLLAHDGTYYAAKRTSIEAYNNEIPFDFTSPIVKKAEYFIDGLVDGEQVVGLTMTHDAAEDAYLIFATSRGHIGGVSLDYIKQAPLVQIPGYETVSIPSSFVSNSIGFDGPNGGILACTSKSMVRLQWTAATHSIALDWVTEYGTGQDEWYWGRLGPGCGTSPTIMGPKGIPEYAVITDGENPMNIRFYDIHSGEEVGKHIVSFGQTGDSFNSTTDQSIVVKGYRAVVVNNWVADSVTPFCAQFFASLNISEALKHECPFIFGAYVQGVEQFEIHPETKEIRSVWANTHVSCTSSIPVVSGDEILYCLGKRSQVTGRAIYTIEAMDWSTGKSVFHVELGTSLLYNSLYAATEIGTSANILMGTLSGIIYVADVTTGTSGSGNAGGVLVTDGTGFMLSTNEMKELEAVWQQYVTYFEEGTIPTK